MSRLLLITLPPMLAACGDYSMYAITEKDAEDDTGAIEEAPESEPEPEHEGEEVVDDEDPGEELPPATSEEEVSGEDCVENTTGFDIEEVSTLQDAFGLPMVRDGLSLEVDVSADSWRPVSVDVLVMFPEWYFDWYEDDNTLSVMVYQGSEPTGTGYLVSRRVRKAELDWSRLRLPASADWSGDDRDQVAAWMSLDLSAAIPEGTFTGPDVFVGVGWDGLGLPNVGYSNFELPCRQNWTDYGDGRWSQNSGEDCSWPMLRIEIETLTEGDCP